MYATNVARFEPAWVESTLPHLVKKSYTSPFWDRPANRVTAYKNVTLLGMNIVRDRKVGYHPDPRLVCIRAGLGVAVGVRLGLGVPQRQVLGASSTLSRALVLHLGPSPAPSPSLALYPRPGGCTLSEG